MSRTADLYAAEGAFREHGGLRSLLYVSRSTLPPADAARAVDAIVAAAQVWNVRTGITGALLFTQGLFAQYLEGPADAIGTLMTNIRTDPRHTDVEIVSSDDDAERRFAGWSLAYAGPAHYVAARVRSASREAPRTRRKLATASLVRLMAEFDRVAS